MQKKANNPTNQQQQQQFAQGPKIFGTGRLMNRIPNLMDQQTALQNQQKIGQEQQQPQQQHPMQHMGPGQGPPPPQQPGNGPEDMFAFQNFLAQISKPGGPQQQQGPPPPQGPGPHPGMVAPPGAGKPMPGGHGRMWGGPEEQQQANMMMDGTPPILKMMMQQQQQQVQQNQQQALFLHENLKRQQQAMVVEALVQAAQGQQPGLRLSPNGEWVEHLVVFEKGFHLIKESFALNVNCAYLIDVLIAH